MCIKITLKTVKDKLSNAFKSENIKVSFASTLKSDPNGISQPAGYGRIYFELPENIQEKIIKENKENKKENLINDPV